MSDEMTTWGLLTQLGEDMASIKRSQGRLTVQRFADINERIRIEGDGWTVECRIGDVEFEHEESNLIEQLGRTFTAVPEPPRTIMRIGSYERVITGEEVVTFLDREKP